jgi:replicative DNA helicase
MPIEMLPPHDPNAEAAVLGSLLIDPDAYYEVSDILTPEAFYQAGHRWLYEAIQSLSARQEPPDILAIANELTRAGRLEEAGGLDRIVTLLNSVPTSVNADVYARIVAEKATRRRLIQAASAVASAAYNEAQPIADVVAAASSAVTSAAAGLDSGGAVSVRSYMAAYLDDFLADIDATEAPRVVMTGLTDLDRLLGGLEAPHQHILAGRTSMGKSSLALGIALHAAMRQDKRVMIFSLEMSREQIINRMVSMMTRIPAQSLKAVQRRYLTAQQTAAVMAATGRITELPLYLYCKSGLRPLDVRGHASRIAAAQGLDMVIVDHMHIMAADAPTGKQVQDLGSIALALANLYSDLNVAGLTLAQLNRGVDARAIKRPMLSDLRESGQIEENAYAVLFVHREGYYDDTAPGGAAEVIVAKNRDGATGSAAVYWNAALSMFGNAAQVQL